jgi:hypothetical protein
MFGSSEQVERHGPELEKALASEGEYGRQGRMTTFRTLIIGVSIVLGVMAAPSMAAANPLLSGYGGPGQGNQALLGSALLNGPHEGSGGGSSGEAAEAASSETEAPASSVSASGGGSGGGSPPGSHPAHRPAHPSTLAPRSTGSASPKASSSTYPLSPTASVGSQPLGLSGLDVLYILLGCLALMMTGAITRTLVRRAP